MDSINLNQQNVTALKNRFDLVTRMGRDMLTSGSEIFRTKQAMHIAARRMGLEEFEVYLLTNGIFATMSLEGKLYSSRIFQVPLSPIMLNRVDELNALSRRIGEGACSPEEVSQELDRIEAEHTALVIRPSDSAIFSAERWRIPSWRSQRAFCCGLLCCGYSGM